MVLDGAFHQSLRPFRSLPPGGAPPVLGRPGGGSIS